MFSFSISFFVSSFLKFMMASKIWREEKGGGGSSEKGEEEGGRMEGEEDGGRMEGERRGGRGKKGRQKYSNHQ